MLDRLGFSVERLHELNPRLVVLSITGFGHDGPEGGRAGYDQIAQGEAGLMSLTGTGAGRADAGRACRSATCWPACTARTASSPRCTSATRTGRGRVVRTSLLAAIVGVHAFQGTRWTVAGEVPHASGNHHPSIAPYGLFRSADAPVQIACGSEGLWRRSPRRSALDRPTRPASPPTPSGWATATRSSRRVDAAFADQHARRAAGAAGRAGIPAGKVRTLDDVYNWDQTRSQGLLVDVDHATSARSRSPARRCASTTARSTAAAEHLRPPRSASTTIRRAWLDESARRRHRRASRMTEPKALMPTDPMTVWLA